MKKISLGDGIGIFSGFVIDVGSGTDYTGKNPFTYLYLDFMKDKYSKNRIVLNIPKIFSENLIEMIDKNIGGLITSFKNK